MPSPSKLLVASNGILELDRRRPGRIEPADAELIPLMRKPKPAREVSDEPLEKWEPRDPVAPPRGIALGVVLCIPIWLAIGEIFYHLLK